MEDNRRNAFVEHLSGRGRALGNAIRHPVRFIGNRFRQMGQNIRGAGNEVQDFFGALFGNEFDPSQFNRVSAQRFAQSMGQPFDPSQFNATSSQRFEESLARRDRPRLPQVNVPGRFGAAGSGQSAGSNTIASGAAAQRMFEAMRAAGQDQSQAARQAMAMMFGNEER